MMKQTISVKRMSRAGIAGLAIVLGLLMTACTARGGGSLAPSNDLTGQFQSSATFGFSLTCGVERGRAVVRGQLDYHDHGPSTIFDAGGALVGTFADVDLHGELDPMITSAQTCDEADLTEVFPGTAQFIGRYRPQSPDPTLPLALQEGTFNVLVFDQGEPGRSIADITGDGFSIELTGGRYSGYTRGGYVQGGNVQVTE